MDRDYLADLFEPFGPVTIRRMFSGFGVSADGVTFALVLQGTIYLRADDTTIARFESEGSQPFSYTTRQRTVTVASYWRLPDRLLDEPDELAEWSRAALAAAERAALAKVRKSRRPKSGSSEAAPSSKPARGSSSPTNSSSKASRPKTSRPKTSRPKASRPKTTSSKTSSPKRSSPKPATKRSRPASQDKPAVKTSGSKRSPPK